MEFNDDLFNDTPEGIELLERSEACSRVKRLLRKLEKDAQCSLQRVFIDEMSLRQTAQQLGISAMTVQRWVKRGLNSLSKDLNAAQLDA